MIRPFLILLATAAISCGVPVTLNFSAQGNGGALGTSGGQELPVGSLVMVGTFDLAPAQVSASGSDHFALLASFRQLGSAFIGNFNGMAQNAPGAFSAIVSIDSAGNSGKRIYLLAFDAPNVGKASSQLVLSSPGWLIPSFGSISCETSQIPFTNPSTVAIAQRQAGVTSPTLGGILNQVIPLTNPDESDNDRDGMPALLEWATGSDPLAAGPSPLVFQNGALTLPCLSGTSGSATDFSNSAVRYFIEVSGNLKTWDTMDVAELGSVSAAAHPTRPGYEILTLGLTNNGEPARFWRLGVTRR